MSRVGIAPKAAHFQPYQPSWNAEILTFQRSSAGRAGDSERNDWPGDVYDCKAESAESSDFQGQETSLDHRHVYPV